VPVNWTRVATAGSTTVPVPATTPPDGEYTMILRITLTLLPAWSVT
jgi:hypothetical protein